MISVRTLEEIIDRSGIAPRIELLLPTGVRARQLLVRTLLLGMLLALADRRPAFLTEVHRALTRLPEADQRRLGVLAPWKTGPHLLTYRQTERTFGLAAAALAKDEPDGLPSEPWPASATTCWKPASPISSKTPAPLWRWTGPTWKPSPGPRPRHQRLRRPRGLLGTPLRRRSRPGQRAVLRLLRFRRHMMPEEHRPAVPELARRMTVCSCHADPARALVPVLTAMPGDGIPLGDILSDSGYAHRDAGAWAIPLRAAGAQLIQDLHPSDRGPRGTHHGAIIANGNLYCPATPRPLPELGPAGPRRQPWTRPPPTTSRPPNSPATSSGRITSDDADGYHRVMCPAVMGKIRCPLRPASMTLDRDRPEILTPPEHPPACCTQQTITVPPDVAAKTRVAVGTALAGGPPHRSQRAGLPHWAPTSGA